MGERAGLSRDGCTISSLLLKGPLAITTQNLMRNLMRETCSCFLKACFGPSLAFAKSEFIGVFGGLGTTWEPFSRLMLEPAAWGHLTQQLGTRAQADEVACFVRCFSPYLFNDVEAEAPRCVFICAQGSMHTAEPASRHCSECGAALSRGKLAGLHAAVLFPEGWRAVKHVTKRCRRQGCKFCGKTIFYNFIAISKSERRFHWTAGSLQFFFLDARHGVSVSWLQQMTRRLFYQYVAFSGEAQVHGAEARAAGFEGRVPRHPGLFLFKSWLYWRFVLRLHQHEEKTQEGRCVNLSLPFAKTLSTAPWYDEHMLQRRLAMAKERGHDLRALVVDGNLKLSGRVCGRPVAELRRCEPLQAYTAVPCSCPPARKARRCDLHMSKAQEGPLDDQAVVAHRRYRVLMAQPCQFPYEVLLKSVDAVLCGVASQERGKWVSAGKCTPRQLEEYWSQQEEQGFISQRTPGQEEVSCRTSKETSKQYRQLVRQNRLGGVLLACTSEGFIVHLQQFVGAETIPVRYFFLAEICARLQDVRCCIHDDACHVARYALKHKGRNALAKRLSELAWVLDRFHSAAHRDPWCARHCHPSVHQELLRGLNTSAAESCNSILGRYRVAFRSIVASSTRSFYLQEIVEGRNQVAGAGDKANRKRRREEVGA